MKPKDNASAEDNASAKDLTEVSENLIKKTTPLNFL